MRELNPLKMLEHTGAIRKGHFVYTSGLHGDRYVNKFKILPRVRTNRNLCHHLAMLTRKYMRPFDTLLGAAPGGYAVAQGIAWHLIDYTSDEICVVCAEKGLAREIFVIEREQDEFVCNQRVLVVDDIVNTGNTAKKLINSARVLGAEVVGVAAICNRGGVTAADLSVPEFHVLVDLTLPMWKPEECPLCGKGIPIDTILGKGREFFEEQQKK